MITRADLVRVVKERFRSQADGTGLNAPDELLAEDAMNFGLLTLYPDDPLYDAMDLIARHHVTGLPIVDRGMNLLGIITEKDVLRSLADPEAIEAPVERFMTR